MTSKYYKALLEVENWLRKERSRFNPDKVDVSAHPSLYYQRLEIINILKQFNKIKKRNKVE